MLVPLSWLNDYVDINVSADELEKKLFDCGFEVEEKWQVGKDISGIVVGYVAPVSRSRRPTFMYARSM